MNLQLAAFYVSAAILLLAALRVITARNPVHAALWLVLAFFTAADLWLLLYAEFLAVALVLVYVGAVMVLFLFVVMMLDINFDRMREGFWRHLPLAGGIGLLMDAVVFPWSLGASVPRAMLAIETVAVEMFILGYFEERRKCLVILHQPEEENS